MIATDSLTLAVLILLAATLYSSVGHAGASGYLAAMALVGVAPDTMKVTALALNVLVAVIADLLRSNHSIVLNIEAMRQRASVIAIVDRASG